jgi:hypothetical protein
MSDRAQAEVILFGVAGKEEALVEIFADWQTEWGLWTSAPALDHFTEGCIVMQDEAVLGIEDEIGAELRELGVSYWFTQDAKYEYPATTEMFTPELGHFNSPQNGEGAVLIYGYRIDQLIKEADGSFTELKVLLNKATGRAHRDAMEALLHVPRENVEA